MEDLRKKERLRGGLLLGGGESREVPEGMASRRGIVLVMRRGGRKRRWQHQPGRCWRWRRCWLVLGSGAPLRCWLVLVRCAGLARYQRWFWFWCWCWLVLALVLVPVRVLVPGWC